MTVPTIAIDTSIFSVYANVPMADLYLSGASHADSWRLTSTTTDIKDRLLITATRILDRQRWVGDKVASNQPLAWPRTNTGLIIDGVSIDGTTPDDIVNADIEIALALLDGSEMQNQQTTATRERSIRAGSVEIVNFRGIDFATRFPLIINELLAIYRSGSSLGIGMKVTGVDTETLFPVEVGFNRGI